MELCCGCGTFGTAMTARDVIIPNRVDMWWIARVVGGLGSEWDVLWCSVLCAEFELSLDN